MMLGRALVMPLKRARKPTKQKMAAPKAAAPSPEAEGSVTGEPAKAAEAHADAAAPESAAV